MVQVSIKYKPSKWRPWKKVKVNYPTQWEDLNQEQFILLVKLLNKGYMTERDRILFVNCVLGLIRFPLYDFPEELTDLNRFIFDLDEPFNRFFIQSIVVDGKAMFGPNDGFYNMRGAEWAFADTFYSQWCKSKDDATCNNVLACLYRPRIKNFDPGSVEYKGDCREEFNDALIDFRSEIMSSVKPEIKEAIMFNYKVMRRWIELKYPHVFPQDKSKLNIVVGRGEHKGWSKFLRNMCNGDLTKLENVSMLYIHDMLQEADDAIAENNKKT